MSVQILPNRPMDADHRRRRFPSQARSVGVPASLAAIQLVLAYEWLVSGINKLLTPNFTIQLASTLHQNMTGNPYGWYVGFLRQIVLPHASLLGVLTELGELSIGVTLALSALLWIRRPHSKLTHTVGKVACLALVGAVVMPLNFFFMSGDPLPWINPANAFNEGVSIDALIPLLSVVLLLANLRAVRAQATRTADVTARVEGGVPWAA